MRISDRFTKACLLFLLVFTPLALGAVHAWAYSLMEGVVALMVLVWGWKIWSQRKAPAGASTVRAWPYVLPLSLFVVYVFFQLVPLPPSVLRVLSPSTYEIYTKALPGWPERAPYADLLAMAQGKEQAKREDLGRGTVAQTGAGAEVPYAVDRTPYTDSTERQNPISKTQYPAPSLPLSLAPLLTQTDLLKFSSYALLFLLVLFYPAPGAARDPQRWVEYETDFIRPLLYTILFTGFLVAVLGFLSLFTWNGKVLWFFVPYDATGGGGGGRASGPFIAPPSFANYLSMILPLMLIATVSRTFLTPQRLGGAFRVLCGFGVFIMFSGVLLSLSRAGWASAALGAAVLVLLMAVGGSARNWLARTPTRRLATLGVGAVGLFLFLVLVFVGPRGQERLDLRLQETAGEAKTLQDRVVVWRNSMDMVRDFSVLGVGLGAWPDLFPKYQDPRLKGFYREAHNDYLEVLAETGFVGVALLAWFFFVCLRTIARRCFALDGHVFPVVASLLAGMCAMAFHEIFDFNLHIPANAILFTIFLGLSVRLSLLTTTQGPGKSRTKTNSPLPDTQYPIRHSSPRNRTALLGSLTLGCVAILLFTNAFSQPMSLYPYYVRKKASVQDAMAVVYQHPANAEAHVTLFDAAGEKLGTAWQIEELERILWLAPAETQIRDAYAARLLLQGRREEAWYEVTRSVAEAPYVNEHFYLSQAIAPTLFPNEQEAVIFGFRKAIEDGHPRALEGLANFYGRTQRFSDLVDLYAEAAGKETDPTGKAEYFLKAADAALRAQQFGRAEELLLEATRLKPEDTALVVKLIEQVYERKKDLASAEKAVAEGIRNGADAVTLQISLAKAARSKGEKGIAAEALQNALTNGSNKAKRPRERYRSYIRLARVAASIGEDDVQEEALKKAIELQPGSYRALMEVAGMHAARQDYSRAAFYYRKATRANRKSAAAYAGLARIEEARFRFAEADRAYANAVRLAPKNEELRRRYEAFKTRVAKGQER